MKGSIRFSGVSKVFKWRGTRARRETLKGTLFHRGLRRRGTVDEQHRALNNIDLEIEPGEAVALIGPNGSGKSTLLKLTGGILKPTTGSVEVDGRVTALIELGAGFHPEITGRENIVINGMLLGLQRNEIEERMQEIVDFADIGSFIDQPVKIYSSGMYVRLGFAVAVAADPDVLLIDEVLAVGDEAFTRRCLDRLARMRQRGVTMVLVSHDLDLVTSFADRALYLAVERSHPRVRRMQWSRAIAVMLPATDARITINRNESRTTRNAGGMAMSKSRASSCSPVISRRGCCRAAAPVGSASITRSTRRSRTLSSALPGTGQTAPRSVDTTPILPVSCRHVCRPMAACAVGMMLSSSPLANT